MFNSALAGGLFNSSVEQRLIQNAGTYFISELERLDPKLNQPLVQFTHTRDIDLREDITIGDTDASFQFSTLGGAGGPDQNGHRYSWVAGNTTNIPAINANVNKVKQDLMLWAQFHKMLLNNLLKITFQIYPHPSRLMVARGLIMGSWLLLLLKMTMDVNNAL